MEPRKPKGATRPVHPCPQVTHPRRDLTAGLIRMAITAPAAFLLGFYFWKIALDFDVYILMRDIGPRYILTAMGIGVGLVVLAGPRNRFIFPLWPVLFYLGERFFELLHLHPFPYSQLDSGLISTIAIAVVIGSIIPALYYDAVAADLRTPVWRPKPSGGGKLPLGNSPPERRAAVIPDTPPSRNSPDR